MKLNILRITKCQNVRQKITDSDKAFHAEQKQVKALSQEAYEDGKFINPNQTSVGAAANTEAQSRVLTPKADFEGEQFVKSNLGIFGENGPWTPVFRLTKSIVPTARKMIADILDTPLLKLKNHFKNDFLPFFYQIILHVKKLGKPFFRTIFAILKPIFFHFL